MTPPLGLLLDFAPTETALRDRVLAAVPADCRDVRASGAVWVALDCRVLVLPLLVGADCEVGDARTERELQGVMF